MGRASSFGRDRMTVWQKLGHMNWSLVFALLIAGVIGFGMLYSAAGGDSEPWAARQMVRFGVGLGIMFAVALIDIRLWLRYAYVIYFACLALLAAVEVMGTIGMGAQRWINIGGVFQLQPSELMKIALVLAVARYFHGLTQEDVQRPVYLLFPLALVAMPAALVLRQPDLGTAVMLILGAGFMFFAAGVRAWKFAAVAVAGLGALPVAWQFLHDYQRQRVLTFLNPESDPLGSGYHIIQSKIALGSGGVFGKGYMQGTQSHLNFLPEMQTDFIFTMLAEETGLIGALGLLLLYAIILAICMIIAVASRSQFGRLVAAGVTATFFLYVFINVAMVTGLIPVVGVPLPLISYGGTAMLTLMVGFGLVMGVCVHRDQTIPRRGGDDMPGLFG